MHSRRLVGALQTKADYPVHVLLPGNPKKSCTGRRAFRHPCTARGGGHGGVGVARLACSRSIDANPRACATPRRWRAAIAATPRAARRLYRSPTCGRSSERPFPLRAGAVCASRQPARSGGRPSTIPFSLARASPALTLSRMMPRSNSAKTPNI